MRENRVSPGNRALRFRTNRSRGIGAIPVLVFFFLVVFALIGLLLSGHGTPKWDSPWRWVALAVILFGLQALLNFARSFRIEAHTVFLYGDLIRGYPLFGKSRRARISQISTIYESRDWGISSLEFRDSAGLKFRIFGELDYLGFVWDYILERVGPECHIDQEFVKKKRNLSGYWIYTRRYPYKTEYPIGYLWPLRDVVTEQRKRLVKEGKLHGGKAFYGDPHLLRIGERDK